MKNIEELRKKQAEELRLAEMTNKIETEHPEIAASGLGMSLYNFEWKGQVTTNAHFHEEYPHKCCEKDAAMLLSIFPANEKFPVYHGSKRQYEDEYYDMRLQRNPSNAWTMLSISWQNDGIRFSFEFPITNESTLLSWFKESSRKLEESEISTWGIQKNRYTVNMRNYFKQLDWANGRIIHYSGATWQQTDHAVMNAIAEHLKYQYQLSEE